MTNSHSTANVSKPAVDHPKSGTAMPAPAETKVDVVTPAAPAHTPKP